MFTLHWVAATDQKSWTMESMGLKLLYVLYTVTMVKQADAIQACHRRDIVTKYAVTKAGA